MKPVNLSTMVNLKDPKKRSRKRKTVKQAEKPIKEYSGD
jgi:hypothetical protein